METTLLDLALIEETAKKSALLWVAGPAGRPRPLWHVWHDGAVWLVGGRGEQPLDGLGLTDGGSATVTARSKDHGGRLVVWPATVRQPAPHSELWRAAVEELRGKRLNAPDPAGLPERWAADCRVLRLAPAGPARQRPGAMPQDSGAAPPAPTPATTRDPRPTGRPVRRARR